MFVKINAKVFNSGGIREVWFCLETKHEDMEELHADLVKEGCLCGTRYETKPMGAGERRVVDFFDTVVMRETISSVQELTETLVDEHGDLIWEA